mgnify:FL=1
MKEREKKHLSAKAFLLRTLADPVLIYAAVTMTAIMYHYRSALAIPYGIGAYVVGWLVFRIFDFINKHKLLGFAAYIALFIMFIFGVRASIEIGQSGYPISWGVWFLSPQDTVEYNSGYTFAIYLLFLIFMLSVIYYFTRVRYRIFMNFLIFIIPFAIYGKEFEKMPTIYIILLCVGYVMMMIYFRELRGDENTEIVVKDEVWKPVAVYAVVFAVAAAVVPKPAIEADRTVLETLISAEQFTDRLVSMLNIFRDSTSSEQFTGNMSNEPIYYAAASEPLRLKTSSFSSYDFTNDSWSIMKTDDDDPINSLDTTFRQRFDDVPMQITNAQDLPKAILLAAQVDSEFAEKYGLSDFSETDLAFPQEKTVSIFTASSNTSQFTAQFAPVPQYAQQMTDTSYNGQIALIYSGLIYAVDERFDYNERFDFTYSSERALSSPINKQFFDTLDTEDYAEMLREARSALFAGKYDIESGDWVDDTEDWEHYWNVLRDETNLYTYYEKYLLDYSDNQRILELAQKLTEGVDSDYEKAKILEQYFYNNDYIYDTGYLKKSTDNAETFLFETKTGVCYEYATSMVLLARAAGIPARYCEGYNMTQELESNERYKYYVATSQSAHGFPELYIRGYGWASFEPTLTDAPAQAQTSSTTDSLARAGAVIFAAALLVLILALFSPVISHKFFLIRMRRKNPDETSAAVMHRICRLCGIGSASTSNEAVLKVLQSAGVDISELAEMFDKSAYGGISLNEEEKAALLADYIKVYDALKEKKKTRRRRVKNT